MKMIKLRDSQGNIISTIQDNGEMSFDEKRIEEEYKKAIEQQEKQKEN